MKNKKLIREYKKGSKKAFEKLVENNMYIVDMVLNKLSIKVMIMKIYYKMDMSV